MRFLHCACIFCMVKSYIVKLHKKVFKLQEKKMIERYLHSDKFFTDRVNFACFWYANLI